MRLLAAQVELVRNRKAALDMCSAFVDRRLVMFVQLYRALNPLVLPRLPRELRLMVRRSLVDLDHVWRDAVVLF